jgi:predicted enzyme related to lactoylglutathione lyase
VGTHRLQAVVLDCPDPRALAEFYAALIGGRADVDDPDWCEVHLVADRIGLGFQRVADYQAPEWPDGRPQQVHLDFDSDDLAASSAQAVALGATVLGEPVGDATGRFQVHADPAGHPFCFCLTTAG